MKARRIQRWTAIIHAQTSNVVDLVGAKNVIFDGTIPTSVTVDVFASFLNEATGNAFASVTRDGDTTNPLTVDLVGLHNGADVEFQVGGLPVTQVVIPSGSLTEFFEVVTIDNAVADGIRTVTVGGQAAGYATVSDSFDIFDDENPQLSISFSGNSMSETDPTGTVVATVTRNTPTDEELIVTVASLDPSEVLVEQAATNNAQNVDAEFSLTSDPNIQNSAGSNISTTVPHVTVQGTGNGTFDYYSFAGMAGEIVVLDMDATNFDTELFLYNFSGSLLAANDDSPFGLDSGSTSFLDSFIQVTLPLTDTYFVGVGKFPSSNIGGEISGATPDSGDVYDLHISVGGHVVSGSGVVVETEPNDSISASGSMTTSIAQVTIPVGSTSVDVPLVPVNDFLSDNDQTATIAAFAPGIPNDSDASNDGIDNKITITDVGSTQVSLSLTIASPTITETGFTTGTVTIDQILGTDLTVNLLSQDPSEAVLTQDPFAVNPAISTVIIPAGSTMATFPIFGVDDTPAFPQSPLEDDGNQTLEITAYAENIPSSSATLTVTDQFTNIVFDEVALVVTGPTVLSEDGISGPDTTTAFTVTRTGVSTLALNVAVRFDETEVSIEGNTTGFFTTSIPAGVATIGPFSVTSVADNESDGHQTVELVPLANEVDFSQFPIVTNRVFGSISDVVDVLESIQDIPPTITTNIINTSISETSTTPATIVRSISGGDVNVDVNTSDSTEAVPSPTTFSLSDGSTTRTIIIEGQDDGVVDGVQTAIITAQIRDDKCSNTDQCRSRYHRFPNRSP